MKYMLPLIALACLLAAGCHDKKPASTESVTDLTAPSQSLSAPVAYTPTATYTPTPVQTYTPEPAMTPTAPTMAASLSSGSTYTVKPGDTLWKIAASHYGDGKKWKQIAEANPGISPQKLKAGQTITLP